MKPAIFKRLIGAILFVFLTIINLSMQLHAQLGYIPAPPCRNDISRNFSVLNAIEALDRAERAQTENIAKDELLTAYHNLEQVMNFGALQWEPCMSCDPYKSIDIFPGHSYIEVARRLVNVSRRIYNRPDYNAYAGLVETIENNFQRENYCGYYANNQVNVDAVSDAYEFGRITPTQVVLCGNTSSNSNFVLTKAPGTLGRTLKSCNFNESFYWLIGNELIFIDGQGAITSVLIPEGPNPDYWEGPFKANVSAGITHYIRRDKKDDPCKDPSWANKTLPKQDAFLGEPPYGGSPYAKDGDKYWILYTGSNQYFMISNGNLLRYNRCGELMVTLVREYTQTRDDGKQQWGGYNLNKDGSKGGGWYIVWDIAPGGAGDPCRGPSWSDNALPRQDAFLGEPPYGGAPYARDGDKYWILSQGSNQYFVVSNGNLLRYNRCGELIVTSVREYAQTRDDGKQQWGGYNLNKDGSKGGGWYLVWE
ncbi:MAG: hypothetical protein JW973_08885 [Bacteroidales bacterium]|nr:hypothetical protein [Bacteroidales bacterium]